jgi:NAD(P)-dependent dehydrogenase (short-subunit alcohol dehydrogenase family)
MKLFNKTIVITGGTTGIARLVVSKCLDEGANVIFGDIDSVKGLSISRSLANIYPNKVIFVEIDLKDNYDCIHLFEVAIKNFKKIDGFVNYAGITPVSSLADCGEETYDAIMDVNLKAAFFCVQQAIKHMRLSGGGSIVLVGSAHSWSGQKDRGPYALSKGGLYTLFEHIAHNYASEHIRCNFITMGWTATEGELALRAEYGESEEQLKKRAASVIPMGRLLTPEDHIPAFLYLLSDDSKMVTGSNIRITGGEYI